VAAASALAQLVRRLVNGFQFSSAFLAQTGHPVTIHGSRTSVCRTYIGSVEVANNPNTTNECAANTLNPPGFDPAIGYALINPHAKYVVAGPGVTVNLRLKHVHFAGVQHAEHVGVKDAACHGGDSFASESGCLQRN
jgi:hypothetical protein